MVEEGDLEEAGGVCDAAGEAVVGIAGEGVAGGVVVDEEECVGGVEEGWAEDFARMGDAFVEAAEGDFLGAQQAVFGVQKQDAQRFALEAAHFCAEQGADGLRGVYSLAAELFDSQSTGEAEGGGELDGFGGAHAVEGGEFGWCSACEAFEGLEVAEQFAGEVQRAEAGDAGA